MKTSVSFVCAALIWVGCGSGPSAEAETPPSTSSTAATGEADTTEAVEEAPPSEPVTLVGEWIVDPSCIPQQRGMEGADQATVDAVAAQLVQNRYRYTETHFEQENPALPQPVTQPYTMVSEEEARWIYELAGPTGAPMQITATFSEGQLQLHREGALELCLRRP